MGPDILVPLGTFAMVVLIVFISVNAGTQKRKAILKVVEEGIRSGQQMTPETIRALGMPRKNTNGDLKAGSILMAVAAALIVFGLMLSGMDHGGDAEILLIFTGIAAFPGFIGAVLLAFGLLGKKKDEAEQA